MSRVRVPTPLRAYVAGQSEVWVSSASVAEALQELVSRYPALRPHLFGETDELRPYINLFVNDQDVRSLRGEQTPLTDGDRLMILPSIDGGAAPRSLRRVEDTAPLRDGVGWCCLAGRRPPWWVRPPWAGAWPGW